MRKKRRQVEADRNLLYFTAIYPQLSHQSLINDRRVRARNDPDGLTNKILGLCDSGVFQADGHNARFDIFLGYSNDWYTFLASQEYLGIPGQSNIIST